MNSSQYKCRDVYKMSKSETEMLKSENRDKTKMLNCRDRDKTKTSKNVSRPRHWQPRLGTDVLEKILLCYYPK